MASFIYGTSCLFLSQLASHTDKSRPVTRPGSEIRRSRPSMPPVKSPTVSERPIQVSRQRSNSFNGHESFISSAYSIMRPQDPPISRSSIDFPTGSGNVTPGRLHHVRSHSFSTVDDHAIRQSLGRPDTFKVVIRSNSRRHGRGSRRPSDDKSVGPYMPQIPGVLDTPAPSIPATSTRSGQFQVSTRGSAAVRSSTQEYSLDPRFSKRRDDMSAVETVSSHPSSFFSRHEAIPKPLFQQPDHSDVLVPRPRALRNSSPRNSTSQLAIHIFDNILKRPDDPSIVRFNASTDEIVAATPSMLIAHITSPSFLDYELLSDFFLTYRVFMIASDLVTFLLARLRWAVDRVDDFGRIVRVRTFVALRHWILNYFSDDFVPDIALRVHFCDLVNGLYHDLQKRSDGGAGDLKIVGELKKCWRRTCGLYWSAARDIQNPEDDVFPGGRTESISLMSESDAPQATVQQEQEQPATQTIAAKRAHLAKASGKSQPAQPSLKSVAYSGQYSGRDNETQLSPTSIQSLHVISCSIPIKPIYKQEAGATVPLVPHPVPVIVPSSAPTAAPFPGARPKRPLSFTDALRDSRRFSSAPLEKVDEKDSVGEEIAGGSLVHGSLYQPATPYFEFRSIPTRVGKLALEGSKQGNKGGLISPLRSPNPDDSKKLFNSIRRAFSSNIPPPPGNPNYQTPEAFYAQEGKASLSNIDLQHLSTASKVQIRIDVLCSWAGERFRLAIEDAQVEEDLERQTAGETSEPKTFAQHLSSLATPAERYPHRSVTVGSRSIVIVDDTNPDLPVMSGALRPPSPEEDVDDIMGVDGRGKKRDRQAATIAGPAVRAPTTSDEKLSLRKPTRKTVADPISSASASKTVNEGVYVPTGYKSEQAVNDAEFSNVGPSQNSISNSMISGISALSSLPRYASHQSGNNTPKADETTPIRRPMSKSSDTNPVTSFQHVPAQKLRRRPGGNLKEATKVHDLEQPKVQRRHSFGSMSTVSKSVKASMAYQESYAEDGRPITPLHGADDGKSHRTSATPRRRKSISLIQTHSSQPNLRPSFEAEVAKLKALPDDDDDGGIETTLLKLEGRYEKKSPSVASPTSPTDDHFSTLLDLPPNIDAEDDPVEEEKHRKHHEHVENIHPEHPLLEKVDVEDFAADTKSIDNPGKTNEPEKVPEPALEPPLISQKSEDVQTRSIYRPSYSTSKTGHKPNKSVAESTASYSSIPLLQRRQRDMDRGHPDKWHPEDVPSVEALLAHAESINSSVEQLVEPKTPKRATAEGGPRRRLMEPITSFLLDDTQELSDDDIIAGPTDEDNEDGGSFFDDVPDSPHRKPETSIQALRRPDPAPESIQKVLSSIIQPPTPIQPTSFHQGLPTPAVSPTIASPLEKLQLLKPSQIDRHLSPTPPQQRSAPESMVFEKGQLTPRQSITPPHLPFILAYDADIVAQHFTLVEKDALDELDWRELIDIRWNQTPASVPDWVSYLRSADAWGAGLIIARFNLMVKWVLSEILLTETASERARTILHFIRIAAASRRMRNFATMYQVTVALLSVDCARLKRTWSLVPSAEVDALRDLERIVQPLRNFHNLRVEMETGPADAGCIPFIGIYTRDLVYNAQKPPFITVPPLNEFEPLVNFERHHTAATIVKTLLRLLEQSSFYKFKKEPELLSRCLWIAALDEADIQARCAKMD
jgi:RasGEF domain/RasGEF N-terminal motif